MEKDEHERGVITSRSRDVEYYDIVDVAMLLI